MSMQVSIARMIRTIADVREVFMVYQTADTKSPRTQTILTDLNEDKNARRTEPRATQLRAP